jgi:hypothetical protein
MGATPESRCSGALLATYRPSGIREVYRSWSGHRCFAAVEATPEILDRDYPEICIGISILRMVRDYENGVAIEELYRRSASIAGLTP